MSLRSSIAGSWLGVDHDVGDPGHGVPDTFLHRARPLVSVGERLVSTKSEREEGDEALVRPDEAKLAGRRTGFRADRLLDRGRVNRDLLAR